MRYDRQEKECHRGKETAKAEKRKKEGKERER